MMYNGKDPSDFPFPPIYSFVYELVDHPSTDSFISWGKSNKSFVIWNQEELIRRKVFWGLKCKTFADFIDKLKRYDFKEIKRSDGLWEFGNNNFVRNRPMLMRKMHIESVPKRFWALNAQMKELYSKALLKKRLENLAI